MFRALILAILLNWATHPTLSYANSAETKVVPEVEVLGSNRAANLVEAPSARTTAYQTVQIYHQSMLRSGFEYETVGRDFEPQRTLLKFASREEMEVFESVVRIMNQHYRVTPRIQILNSRPSHFNQKRIIADDFEISFAGIKTKLQRQSLTRPGAVVRFFEQLAQTTGHSTRVVVPAKTFLQYSSAECSTSL